MARKETRNRDCAQYVTRSGATISCISGRVVSDPTSKAVKAVCSAVSFYRETVKSPDIRGIMEDLSKL